MSVTAGSGRPPAEVRIDPDLVRALLSEQHPDLQEEELTMVAEGWDNVTVRVGSGLAARLPRRRAAVSLLLNERRWLPAVAGGLKVSVPVPLRMGRPGCGYPWPWTLVPWIPGRPAHRVALQSDQAPRLARLLRTLHRSAPPGAPANPFRGVPLRRRSDDELERRFGEMEGDLSADDLRTLRELWARGLDSSECERPVWLHGDLHPGNVLVRRGEIAGIIDWGDLTAGDPATDLAAAWMLFPDPEERRSFWTAYGAHGALTHGALMARSRAWAVLFGVTLAASRASGHERVGRGTLRRLLQD